MMHTQKLIGLIGGTSWPSTMLYYDLINQQIREQLGEFHTARIMLYSIDYNPIRSLYYEPNGWQQIPGLLKAEIETALIARPDCLIICNNALHKAFDIIETDLNLSIPFFHPAKLATAELQKNAAKRILLLANLLTMEDGFFAKHLEFAGMQVAIPHKADRELIHAAQTQLASGDNPPIIRQRFVQMLKKYQNDFDAVVLACTELPMAIDQASTPMTVINPLQLQCSAAVEFALSANKKPQPGLGL